MTTKQVFRAGKEIKLLEFVPDIYLVSDKVNETLQTLRLGVPTWFSAETNRAMKISVWVYDDLHVNAFCCYKDTHNYVALSVGLLHESWNAAKEFVDQGTFSLVFKVSEDKKSKIKEAIFHNMINFTIAHECGHIAHGHLKDGSCENSIDEMLTTTEAGNVYAKNWNTQLKEYDADSFAVLIQALLLLQAWSDDHKTNIANIDILFIANYLSFRILAEKTGRRFDQYMMKAIAEVDHPHPGVRMYYSVLLFSYWIGRAKGYAEDVLDALSSGTHAVVAYEKWLLEAKEIKVCYFSVAFTEKGSQHIMNLNNGWQELIGYFNQYAYIPIERLGNLLSLPVSVNERGTFINTHSNGSM